MELFSGMGSKKDQILIKRKQRSSRSPEDPDQVRTVHQDLWEPCGRRPAGPAAQPRVAPGPGQDGKCGTKGVSEK